VSENLDLVRSIFADWECGDFRSVEWADPEIETLILGAPYPRQTKGVAEMAEGFRAFVSTWEGYRVEAEEFRELDDKCVLVLIHDAGRGKGSGLELEQIAGERAMLFELRAGKVHRFVTYWDRDRALSDLGLEG
jgi:ketosteroid isomerase-like protein